MAPPVWAYQVDNFIPPPDEELVCSICQAIFCDPVQSPCNHVFCRTCIAKWLETSRNCPICRKRTTRSTLQEVVPIVKNMIMKLILRCHNSERGCKAKFSLESCESHVKDCQFELIQCKNKPCKQMCVRKDMKEHETNTCLHSYVRCNSCRLKVSSRSTIAHNCVDELRIKLMEKDEKLKEYRQKLKTLKEELKSIRESEDFTSDSSIVSISPAEILFNFTENSNLSEFSSISSDDSANQQSSADESEAASSSGPTRESMMFELEQLQERINDHFGQIRALDNEQAEENNSSIEYPRASSTVSLDDSSVLAVEPEEVFVEEEPENITRPAKRRLLTQILDSTDEDEQLEVASQPSRKRTFHHQNGIETAATDYLEPIAGPSYRSCNIDSSTSNNDSSPSNRSGRFKLRPKLKSRCTERQSTPIGNYEVSSSVPSAQNGNPVFEKTLTLLEQYNLESDPEWLPPTSLEDSYEADNNDESDSNLYEFRGRASSNDESSSSDIDSDSSYEDCAEGRTSDLLNHFYASSDSDEWIPPPGL